MPSSAVPRCGEASLQDGRRCGQQMPLGPLGGEGSFALMLVVSLRECRADSLVEGRSQLEERHPKLEGWLVQLIVPRCIGYN